MALGDITCLENQEEMGRGARVMNVALGTTINAGEPVQVRALGNTVGFVVEPALTSTPDASAHLYIGVAATTSTNTTTAAGQVWVYPLDSNQTWLITPNSAAAWDTQAEYNALMGARVLLNNSVSVTATPTSGTYTILATDSTNNGCVVQYLDIFKYPGKVAFAFRDSAGYLT